MVTIKWSLYRCVSNLAQWLTSVKKIRLQHQFTNYRRSNDWGNSLEHQQQSKSVSKFVKSQEVDKDDAGQTDVGSTGHPEYGTVDGLSVVVLTEHAQSHWDPADDEAGVVEIETVNPGSVWEPAQEETGHSVGYPDDRQEEGCLVPLYPPGLSSVLRCGMWVSGGRLVIPLTTVKT